MQCGDPSLGVNLGTSSRAPVYFRRTGDECLTQIRAGADGNIERARVVGRG